MRSTSSPNSSMRTGSRPVVGNTSTMSPRTATWPRSSTAADALVAGGDERATSSSRQLLARAQLDRRGPARGRRDALDQRLRRDRHEAAARERVESARALADEVRRGLEAGAVGDAARRQEADRVRRQEPRRRLGQRHRGLVVFDHDDERALLGARAGAPQGGDERRQDRLGHPRARDPRRGARRIGREGLVAEQVAEGQLGSGQRAVHLLLQAVHTGMVGCVPPCRRKVSECAV